MTVADKKNTKKKTEARGPRRGGSAGFGTAGKRRVVSALPKSKAKNAYDLLSEVVALIRDEPKRYNQSIFIAYPTSDFLMDAIDAPKGFPACGTIGCVAGWVATMKIGGRLDYAHVKRDAARILGLNVHQTYELFYHSGIEGEPQTEAYAAAGVAHIRAFQKANAAQLKAKSVIA